MSLLEKFKAFLAVEKAPEVAVIETKFLDAKLVDGTIVRVEGDAFKVGDKIQVMTEAGEVVDAPVGEHELEDGTVIVVDGESKITEVRQPEVAVEESEEVMADAPVAEAETPEVANDEEARIAALETAVKDLQDTIEALIAKLMGGDAEMTKLKAEHEAVKLENEKLSKIPAAKPVSTKKFEKTETSTKSLSRIDMLLANNKETKK